MSSIQPDEGRAPSYPLNAPTLDQFKDKIAWSVILAVIIEFFRAVVDIHFDAPLDVI